MEEESCGLVCVATKIEFPRGVGRRVTFQSREFSIQPRSRSMVNTHERSGCLIKEQIICLTRRGVRHNPEMQQRETQGKRKSSSTLGNRKNPSLIGSVQLDFGGGGGGWQSPGSGRPKSQPKDGLL